MVSESGCKEEDDRVHGDELSWMLWHAPPCRGAAFLYTRLGLNPAREKNHLDKK